MIKVTNHKVQPISSILNTALARLGSPEQVLLVHLWQSWPVVMGDDLTSLVYPLGHNNDILNVGGEDSVSLQEISMRRDEILERANAFLEKIFFTDINICLIFGKIPLNMLLYAQDDIALVHKTNLKSSCTGKHLKEMNKDSAVAKCYAKFSKLNGEDKYID